MMFKMAYGTPILYFTVGGRLNCFLVIERGSPRALGGGFNVEHWRE